jgi:DNA-directed RNA polymerase specialized sigma24 family protein
VRRLESREVLTFHECVQHEAPDTGTEQEAVAELIAGLPGSQRHVIVMLKVTRMSLEEVARTTSSTVAVQKRHIVLTQHYAGLSKDPENAS